MFESVVCKEKGSWFFYVELKERKTCFHEIPNTK